MYLRTIVIIFIPQRPHLTCPKLSMPQFVPSWVRTWYLINLLILTPDWTYIKLRPRSQDGGDLAWLFPLFNIYARADSLFRDEDRAVECIYSISAIDLLIVLFLFVSFRANAQKPWYAILAIVRAVFVATKTLLYGLYSVPYITPKWRLPIFLMNGQWFVVPCIVICIVSHRIVQALDSTTIKKT